MNEQELKTVTPYEMLEAMLLAISPDDYEEAFRDFAENEAENSIEAEGAYFDHEGNLHFLTKGTYVSITDLEACLIFLAKTADELNRDEDTEEAGLYEVYVKHLLEEHLRPGELGAFATLCCFHHRIGEPDIGGDWIYIIGNNRDDDKEAADAPFEERCLLHADAIGRMILALGKYLDFRDQVETTIDDFTTKYEDIYYPE